MTVGSVNGIAVDKGVLMTMLLKEAARITGTAKVRDDEQKSGIRRMRWDESAFIPVVWVQQDKVLHPL